MIGALKRVVFLPDTDDMVVRASIWLAGALVLSGLATESYALAAGAPAGGRAVALGWLFAALGATIASLVAAVRVASRVATVAWLVWAVAAACFAVGATVRAAGDMSFPSAADAFWLTAAALTLAGLAYEAPRGEASAFVLFVLDALPVVLCVTLLSRAASGHPFDGHWSHEAVVFLYPVLYVSLALVGLQFVALERWRSPSVSLWALGIALPLLALAAVRWPGDDYTARTGALRDFVWTLGLAAYAIAGLLRAVEPTKYQPLVPEKRDRGVRSVLPVLGVSALILSPLFVPAEFRSLALGFTLAAFVAFAIRMLVVRRARWQAVEALEERERRFRTLVGNIPGAVYRCKPSPPWTMEYLSSGIEDIVGYPASDFIADAVRTYGSVQAPEDTEVDRLIQEAVTRREPFEVEYRVVHADGTRRWVYEKGQAVYDANGNPLWLDGVFFDVTPRKEAEAELERAHRELGEQNERLRELDRLKDEFVSLVSHELRTPLTSICGYLELVRDEADDSLTDEQRRYLGVVERNAERLLRLVGDLLFVAQLDSGRLALQAEPVALDALVHEAVESARPAAETKGIRLESSVERPVTVLADRARLAQLLDNLVSNAVKFTPEGAVAVSLRPDGERVLVEVVDTGIGIPASEQRHLFERFFRSSVATERAIQGTGLGLVIAKAIAEAHGGSIELESAENAGTTFRVALPLGGVPVFAGDATEEVFA